MTLTISQIYNAIQGLKLAAKNLVVVEVRHLDDGQKDVFYDACDRIEESIRELSAIENELRHGTSWVEPDDRVKDVLAWAKNRRA